MCTTFLCVCVQTCLCVFCPVALLARCVSSVIPCPWATDQSNHTDSLPAGVGLIKGLQTDPGSVFKTHPLSVKQASLIKVLCYRRKTPLHEEKHSRCPPGQPTLPFKHLNALKKQAITLSLKGVFPQLSIAFIRILPTSSKRTGVGFFYFLVYRTKTYRCTNAFFQYVGALRLQLLWHLKSGWIKLTPGSTGCIQISVRRHLDEAREEMGELVFGNILFGGLIMSLATAAEGKCLNWLASQGSGDTEDTLGKVDSKHSGSQLAQFKHTHTHRVTESWWDRRTNVHLILWQM